LTDAANDAQGLFGHGNTQSTDSITAEPMKFKPLGATERNWQSRDVTFTYEL